jgi:hypothetical protein
MTRAWCALAAVAAIGCSEPERDKPEPPDMSELVEGYTNPTRAFDDTAAAEIETLLEQRFADLLDALGIADFVEDVFASLGEDDDEAARFAPVDLEGSGYARITRICSGHGDPAPPVDQDANGFLALTVGYTEDGLDPIVFGGATDCREQLGDTELVVRGDVNLYIGTNLTVADAEARDSPILFQLAGFELVVDGTSVLDGGFDFQVCRGTESTCVDGYVELLFDLGGGTLVLFIDPETKAGGFRGSNGVWTCDFLGQECTNDDGDVVVIPEYEL